MSFANLIRSERVPSVRECMPRGQHMELEALDEGP